MEQLVRSVTRRDLRVIIQTKYLFAGSFEAGRSEAHRPGRRP
jgi:hypothetical protein